MEEERLLHRGREKWVLGWKIIYVFLKDPDPLRNFTFA